MGAGRPRKDIDNANFVKLCHMQCTAVEVAGFFGCSHDTIERYCKREYDLTYGEVFSQLRAGGLISLRRNQFKLSEKNATMAIWLGKQYLAQKDIITFNNLDETEDDPLTASILASMGTKDKK